MLSGSKPEHASKGTHQEHLNKMWFVPKILLICKICNVEQGEWDKNSGLKVFLACL